MLEIPKLIKPQADPAPKWFHIAVALSMVLSTLSAVYGSLRTSATMESLVKENTRLVMANSTPLLEFSHGNVIGADSVLNFNVENVGNGPARVVWFELKLNNHLVPDMYHVVNLIDPMMTSNKIVATSSSIAPRLISSGKSIQIFNWKQPDATDKTALAAWQVLNTKRHTAMSVQACYCSVLDACWISDLAGSIPKSVPSCDATGHIQLKG